MSYATEQGVLNAQWNTEQERQITAQAQRAPHVLMRPRVFPDGNAWCALYGENIQEGVVGFGETPEAAAADFDLAWRQQVKRPSGVKPSQASSIPVVCEHCDEIGNCTAVPMCAARGSAGTLPTFDDPRVQAVYAVLCDEQEPPKGEHWEGFTARRIVAALGVKGLPVPRPTGEGLVAELYDGDDYGPTHEAALADFAAAVWERAMRAADGVMEDGRG